MQRGPPRLLVAGLAHHRGCTAIPGGMTFYRRPICQRTDRPGPYIDAGRADLFADFLEYLPFSGSIVTIGWALTLEGDPGSRTASLSLRMVGERCRTCPAGTAGTARCWRPAGRAETGGRRWIVWFSRGRRPGGWPVPTDRPQAPASGRARRGRVGMRRRRISARSLAQKAGPGGRQVSATRAERNSGRRHPCRPLASFGTDTGSLEWPVMA